MRINLSSYVSSTAQGVSKPSRNPVKGLEEVILNLDFYIQHHMQDKNNTLPNITGLRLSLKELTEETKFKNRVNQMSVKIYT